MYQGKKILAIIPARGGSKGLPGKNIKELCGKPLISWSIESGLESLYIDEVMVNTDSEEFAVLARESGAKVPFIRPAELASDTAITFDVVEHTIKFYKDVLKQSFDYVILLEPTSPLREKGDIDNMLKQLIDKAEQFDSIISVGEVAEHPSILKRIEEDTLVPFCPDLPMTNRRQDTIPAYFPYGVAYISKVDSLLEEKTFYCKKSDFYIIRRHQCYEIDDIYDFIAIEAIKTYLEK